MSYKYQLAVIGAGSYGTALAISIARNKQRVLLWGRDAQQMADIEKKNQNEKYLPDIILPETLDVTSDFHYAVTSAMNILLVVPSNVFKNILIDLKPFFMPNQRILWASKGLEPNTGKLLSTVIQQELGDSVLMAIISGPTFSREMAIGLPTAISVASNDPELSNEIAHLLHCPNKLRVYINRDMIGLQIGGIIKNIIAIATGISDGLGYGANARIALINRGLFEMQRLGVFLGADEMTFMGMACLGDLVLTCTDNQSRNRRFGIAIGEGKTLEQAIDKIGQVVEGVKNTKEVYFLAQKLEIDLPITEQVYLVLYKKKSIFDVVKDLLSREIKIE